MSIYYINKLTGLLRDLWKHSGIYMRPFFFDFNHNVGSQICGFTLSPEGCYNVSIHELISRIEQLCKDTPFYVNPIKHNCTQEIHMLYAETEEVFQDYISGQIHGWLCGEVVSLLGTGSSISAEEYRAKSIAIKRGALRQYMENHPLLDPIWYDRVTSKHLSRD